jgi:hypothetical protein
MKRALVIVSFLFSMSGFSQQEPPPNMTQSQFDCMNKILGTPSQNTTPPTREEIQAAAKKCGVSLPPPPPEGSQQGPARSNQDDSQEGVQ